MVRKRKTQDAPGNDENVELVPGTDRPRARPTQQTASSNNNNNNLLSSGTTLQASGLATVNPSHTTTPRSNGNPFDTRPSQPQPQGSRANQAQGQTSASQASRPITDKASGDTAPSSSRNPPGPRSSQVQNQSLPDRSKPPQTQGSVPQISQDYDRSGFAPRGSQNPTLNVGKGAPTFKPTGLKNGDMDPKKGEKGTKKGETFSPNYTPPVSAEGEKGENESIAGLDKSLMSQSRLPPRPQYGELGTKVVLRTNLFHLRQNQSTEIFRYTVKFKADDEAVQKKMLEEARQGKKAEKAKEENAPEETKEDRKPEELTARKRRQCFELLLQEPMFAEAHPGVATNYGNIVLTCKELPLGITNTQEIEVTYVIPNEPSPRPKPVKHKLIVTSAGRVPLADFVDYLKAPNVQSIINSSKRQQILQDIQSVIIRQPSKNRTNFSGSKSTKFYPFDGNAVESSQLVTGVVALKGYYTSVRSSTLRLLANVNVCTSAFYEHGNLAEIMKMFIKEEASRVGPRLMEWLIGLRVQRIDTKRVKAIQGLNKQDASQYMIELQDGKTVDGESRVSVEKYWNEEYKDEPSSPLRSPKLPLINVGSKEGTPPCYLPPEILEVLPGQPYRKKLGKGEAQMAQFGARPPAANAARITNAAQSVLGLYPKEKADVLPEFGVSVLEGMLTVKGRILSAPKVMYAGKAADSSPGRWDIAGKTFSDCKTLRNWSFLSLAGPSRDEDTISAVVQFQKAIATYGLGEDKPEPRNGYCVSLQDPKQGQQDVIIRDILAQADKDGRQFLLVILPSKDTFVYSRVKYWAEVRYGIHTVCCVLGHKNAKPETWANIVLKVNLRLGGVNQRLRDNELGYLTKGDTMIVGIDVTHPSPGSMDKTRSIAAVVANKDDDFAQWPASLRLQEGKKEIVAEIRDMFIERLKAWEGSHKDLPKRIIVYRDGVAENQYDEVLSKELQAINEARKANYPETRTSELVMIIVGKRHHTRFYPTGKRGGSNMDATGNCKHGTVVDRGITMEKGWDFYLQVHNAIKGTAKPAHYVVVHNEAGPELTTDKLEQLTHKLCYLFGRSTTAVSICPPVYYADLACSRGRAYLQKYLSAHKAFEQFNVNESGWGDVHERLRGSMFYI